MPKIIVKCKYIKGVKHRGNMIKYMATRDGVEKIYKKNQHLPSTLKQKEMIAQLIEDYPDSMFEFSDYIKNSTRENASECINSILEHNLDKIATKQNYVDYIANRSRVEKIGDHGMFSDTEQQIDLHELSKEVGGHEGNVWTNIISLRREDAKRLGYDHADSWIKLCRSKRNELAATMNIKPENLKWYAAFHNESHHPHIHMIAYSKDIREGYVSKQSIAHMRSMYAKDIFKQDLLHIYKEQTVVRDAIKKMSQKEISELISILNKSTTENNIIQSKLKLLSDKLAGYQGRKVYQYLPSDMKQLVNDIVSELERNDTIQTLLKEWWNHKDEINRTYHDLAGEHISLSQIKEFKSIKNMIIKEASSLEVFFCKDDCAIKEIENEYVYDEVCEETVDGDESSIDINHSSKSDYCMEWSDEYKKTKTFLYGNDDVKQDIVQTICILEDEAVKKNVLAISDLANIYAKGIDVEVNEEKATNLYEEAFLGFQNVHKHAKDNYAKEYSSYRIGKMFCYGQGCEQDYLKAEQWFLKAPMNKYALYNLGCIYSRGLGMLEDKEKGFACFEKASTQGNPYASYEAGRMIEGKEISGKPELLSTSYYERAYEGFRIMEEKNHDDNLQYRLGQMCYSGKGIEEKNVPLAIRYLKQSVKMQNKHAMFLLARIYLEQEDIENIPQALLWLEELALEGNLIASNIIAKEYKTGLHIERDLTKAIFYYKKSTEQNDSFAQYQLAKIYEMLGDKSSSMEYLTLSAENGNEYAQYILGKELLNEDIFDIDKSIYWLKEAADKNNQFAQYTLGKLFLFGKYVEQDKELAMQYLEASALQGNEYAQYLIEHKDDPYHQQSTMLMTTRLFHHLGNIFTQNMLPDMGNPLLHVDKKLRQKTRMKKQALGHKVDDTNAMKIK